MKLLNYIKVNKQIATAGLLSKKDIKKIAEKGYDVVINLSVDDDRSLNHESKIVAKNGMVYIHIPISWTKPQEDRMYLFFHILDAFIKQNKKVFIHCMKNYRVSVFIYRYKKDILKEKNVKLIAPKEYKPNKVWKKLLK
ncbi:MAG: protein tyrosine phosphatase family protein [Arcobacteraceae bacterium]